VIGEETSQRLGVVPAQFRMIVTHRRGDRSGPAPERLIKGGLPTEAMVASGLPNTPGISIISRVVQWVCSLQDDCHGSARRGDYARLLLGPRCSDGDLIHCLLPARWLILTALPPAVPARAPLLSDVSPRGLIAVRLKAGRQRVVAPPLTVELREVTKHTRRIPRCHTSRRDVLGDDAARTNYGAAADADAGKDNRL
jgi:hypothetical protein